jgi:ubiquinone/menaquinone biosynthesis C-methylase UbiE
VIGVDFSSGMLTANRKRTNGLKNIHLVEADVAGLPFAGESFDAATCSHAFYELKGKNRELALNEIVRVLKPGKAFLMMEHDIPRSPMTRALFYIRMGSMGAREALRVLKHEKSTLEHHFRSVEKVVSHSGRSKIMICLK